MTTPESQAKAMRILADAGTARIGLLSTALTQVSTIHEATFLHLEDEGLVAQDRAGTITLTRAGPGAGSTWR